MDGLMIGEVAKQGGVNLETIRYYEREGLIAKPPRSNAGYRAFPIDAVRRIRFIKQAQELAVLRKFFSSAKGHRGLFLRRQAERAKRRTSPDPVRHFRLTF